MKQIFGNLKKYWYVVLIIILLLLVQAFCDLALPDYTSNIIDVGISNSGVEHGVPEYLTEEGYMTVASFMTEEELKEWKDIYSFDEENNRYELKETDRWQELDDKFDSVIAIAFMMSSQSQSEDGNGPDMAKMAEYGIDMNSPTLMLDIRKVFEKEIRTLGDTMISSMSKQFAKAQYEACHIDIDKLQTNYLWRTGGKMLAMALLTAIVAILVGYFASKVAAGVGRDLRGKIYKKVIGFSNAELDKFSTASLITRSTNDVQQIQQVTVFMLRMVMYAPILAIGGIINIQRYNSGMSWIIVLAIAAVLCLIVILMSVAMPKFKIMQDKVDRVNLVSREILTGLPVIRAFSRERREDTK